jgi:hypothetical protein
VDVDGRSAVGEGGIGVAVETVATGVGLIAVQPTINRIDNIKIFRIFFIQHTAFSIKITKIKLNNNKKSYSKYKILPNQRENKKPN